MQCPICHHDVVPGWKPLYRIHDYDGKELGTPEPGFDIQSGKFRLEISAHWMRCPNASCTEFLLLLHRKSGNLEFDPRPGASIKFMIDQDETWFALPRYPSARALDPAIPEDLRRDYGESWAILEISPRMSAVLSRRILSELLKRYGNYTESSLSGQTQSFIKNTNEPLRLRENVEYLREMGNFGAHTQTDDAGVVVDVEPEEAAWTIEVVDSLFQHFVTGPEQERKRRAAFDAKIEATGRKPVKKPSSETD